MIKQVPLVPARVARQIVFQCGCIADYPMIGAYSDKKDWHVIPCLAHAELSNGREIVSNVAHEEWQRRLAYDYAPDSSPAIS